MNLKNRINNKLIINNPMLNKGIQTILIPTIINSLLFLLGDNLGLFPDNVINPETGQPMAIFEIIFASFGVNCFNLLMSIGMLTKLDFSLIENGALIMCLEEIN